MKKAFDENIKLVQQLIKDNQVNDKVKALCWVALLKTMEEMGTGEFYNELFYGIILDDQSWIEHLKQVDLFPEKIYDISPPEINHGGYCYVVCYDFIDHIGVPVFAVKSPNFKFKDLSEERLTIALDAIFEIYQRYLNEDELEIE